MSDPVVTIERGNRFEGDQENLCLYMKRSKNLNLVVYEAHVEPDASGGGEFGVSINSKKPVEGYWLDIDPKYVEKARKKGRMHDKVEFNFMESSMAYGVTATAKKDSRGEKTQQEYGLVFVALKKRPMTLRLDKVKVSHTEEEKVLPTTHLTLKHPESGEEVDCIMDHIDVNSKEGIVMPTVQYIDLVGYSATTGERIVERVQH